MLFSYFPVMSISENIRNIRKSKGLTQADLAKLLHVDQTHVSKWERGTAPTTDSLKALASALNVPVSALLGEPDDEALDLLNFLRRHLDPSTLRALSELVEGSSEEDLEALREILRQYPRSSSARRQAIRLLLREPGAGGSGHAGSKSA